jgi:hypothetical protein
MTQQSSLGTPLEASAFVGTPSAVVLSGTTTLGPSDYDKYYICTGSSAYTVTLPTPISYSGKYINITVSTTSNALILISTLSGNITLGAAESVKFISDGTNFFIVSINTQNISCSVKMSVDQSIAPSTPTLLNFDTILDERGLFFDDATHIYTPKYPGLYEFILSLHMQIPGNDTYMTGSIYKNGSAIASSQFSIPVPYSVMNQVSFITNMNGTTDNISLYAMQTSAGTNIVESNGALTFFQANRIGYI